MTTARSEPLEPWNDAVRAACNPLPGSVPYDNRRPVRVTQRFDGENVRAFLSARFPHVAIERWLQIIDEGRLLRDERPVAAESRVEAGDVLVRVVPDTIEPDVACDIAFLWADAAMIAVAKPAPLPMHPSGRFNHNTLISILKRAQPDAGLRIVHRLDADTTGVVVFARTATAARELGRQFEAATVRKTYLARVDPAPPEERFSSDAPIEDATGHAGSRRVGPSGQRASTAFRRLRVFEDGAALLEVVPRTGRTHQIRIHLEALGHPIVGDTMYDGQGGAAGPLAARGTLCLHARSLEFDHPATGERLLISAPSPAWNDAPEWPLALGLSG